MLCFILTYNIEIQNCLKMRHVLENFNYLLTVVTFFYHLPIYLLLFCFSVLFIYFIAYRLYFARCFQSRTELETQSFELVNSKDETPLWRCSFPDGR